MRLAVQLAGKERAVAELQRRLLSALSHNAEACALTPFYITLYQNYKALIQPIAIDIQPDLTG